jgi:alpha-D-xyloside xylohydrolase
MKFTDGGWLIKEGFDVKYAVQVYDTLQKEDRFILYLPYSNIDNKGATLDGGMLTMELFSPLENVIGVRLYNFKGIQATGPHFDLTTQPLLPNIETAKDLYRYTNGEMTVEITMGKELNVTFLYKGKLLTQSKPTSKAYVVDPENVPHISDQLTINVGEKIYGLGERFTNFVKNGQSVDIWNADGGTGSDQSYKNIPFYLSNRNYGVFVDSPDKVSFEVGSEKVSKVQFSVPGEEMTYYVIAGDTPKEVLTHYTALTGRPALPPAWSFGLWLSTSFLTNYDEQTVTSFVDGMLERDIPLDVFHFDCLWMKEYEWCNFTWDERTFPEPEKMLQRLKAKGLKICVWINPYIGQKSPLFDEGVAGGYFLKRANGDVWQWDKWQAGMAIVDFTNPAAVAWYTSKLKRLLDMGVDCFKTDFGERIPTDAVYFNHANPQKMHNYYAYLYNKVVYDLLVDQKGKSDAIVFARSASVGSQQLPVHWGGDSTSDYPSMAESLRAGLSFGLSGFGYWSHDISGFEAGATPDLYKRWTQFGLLSSHSRYHGSWEYKVPWIYGDEAVDVTRFFTKLKMKLMPYLQAQSVYTTQTGVPMMRAMLLDFPKDVATYELDLQYMLGDNLLVAPIFNETGQATYYLPNTTGLWTDYLTNKTYAGGQWYEDTYDYFHLPLLVKPNSIIIQGSCDNHAAYAYEQQAEIHIFEPVLDDVLHEKVYDEQGQEIAAISFVRTADYYHVELTGFVDAKIMIHDHSLTATSDYHVANYDGSEIMIPANYTAIYF